MRFVRDWNIPLWALLRGEYRRIQPEAMSVAVSMRTYWPEAVCPQWWRTKIRPCRFAGNRVFYAPPLRRRCVSGCGFSVT